MFRKLMLTTVAVAGVMFATSGAAEAHGGRGRGGYGHHHHNQGYRWNGGPRVIVAPPVYNYGVPYGYGVGYDPYCAHGVPYGYGYGYQPYGQAFGVRTGNFSLFLGR